MKAANPAVKAGPAKVEIPLNPVVHRGEDSELFWLGNQISDENVHLVKSPATPPHRHLMRGI